MIDRPEYQWGETPPPEHIAKGWGCRKWDGREGCWCGVGWPPEQQCPDCREDERRDSYCYCPPKEVASVVIPSEALPTVELELSVKV